MRTFAVLMAVGTAVACGWLADGGDSSPLNANAAPASRPPAQAIGSAGCAANGCHGNVSVDLPTKPFGPLAERGQEPESWKSSYLQWANLDKHSRAYEVLKNERSQRIVRNMKLNKDGIGGTDGTTHWQCLACHSNPTLAQTSNVVALQQEGVGCESCHGNASDYRSPHTGWSSLTGEKRDKAFEHDGMTRLYDPHVRAETCAGCHVGAPADPEKGIPLRDVHHDMIAAGHPRLNFEFTSYLRRMPAHWKERDRSAGGDRPKGFEGDFWAVGQKATAEAALKLLHSRATSKDAEGRWPEFAEFNCYACHHDLQPASWRADTAKEKPKFGSLVWNRPGIAADGTAGWADQLQAVGDKLKDKAFIKDSAEHKQLVDAIDTALKGFQKAGSSSKLDATKLATSVDVANLDWDQAARLYQALIAATNAKLSADPNWEKRKTANDLRADLYEMLRFDRTKEKADRMDSPFEHDPKKVREKLSEWQKLF